MAGQVVGGTVSDADALDPPLEVGEEGGGGGGRGGRREGEEEGEDKRGS